jgi:hypothetical protein
MSRTIHIIGQTRIGMRYQSWFCDTLCNSILSVLPEYDPKVQLLRYHPDRILKPTADFFSEVLPIATMQELECMWRCCNALNSDSDIILSLDGSLPGVAGIVAAQAKQCKMYSIIHGTSFNTLDIFPKEHQSFERYLLSKYDKLFVASDYHATKLREQAGLTNVVNLGWLPTNPHIRNYIHDAPRPERIPGSVCCVARSSKQKRDVELETRFTQATGVKVNTPDRPFKVWYDYFDFIARHEFLLSTAQEETFGYPIIEAQLLGTKPLCPNAFSYPEVVAFGDLVPYYLFYRQGSLESLIETYKLLEGVVIDNNLTLSVADNFDYNFVSQLLTTMLE